MPLKYIIRHIIAIIANILQYKKLIALKHIKSPHDVGIV